MFIIKLVFYGFLYMSFSKNPENSFLKFFGLDKHERLIRKKLINMNHIIVRCNKKLMMYKQIIENLTKKDKHLRIEKIGCFAICLDGDLDI